MAKQNKKRSSRFLAVEILEKVETKGAYSNLLLNQTIENGKIEKKEINLLTELVYGVMQRKYALDYQLAPFLKNPDKLENWVRQVLRISLYQLEYLDRIPNHAIVDEAVNIAKIRGHKGISGLVNGVLRNIGRKGLRSFSEISDEKERIEIQYSLPKWMVERFVKEYGVEETEKLAASFLEKSEVSIRVNSNLISIEEVRTQLKEEGYEVEDSQLSPSGLISKTGMPARSELFQSGKITIQDESSMLVAPLLQIEPHHQVLDACAAPGGKTTHMATYLDEKAGGKITALDLHEHKVKLIKENAKRQHVSDVVEARALDARKVIEEFGQEKFDRILIDAPCSGLGLMRRKPEIRYTKTAKDVEQLQKVQLDILNQVALTLKKEGRLVYSTCTLLKEENDEVLDLFLNQHPDFEIERIEHPSISSSSRGTITLLSHQYGTDGFYIGCLKRK